MNGASPDSGPSADRLGLALAGGGFRAALFHLGVLHRLAELDLLRYVQVLSTVSGGSIIGAVYVLRLKRWLEAHGRLDRRQYMELVDEVDDILCRGIRRNLRTRLLLNPLTTLRVMLTEDSIGRAMARLYERHLLGAAVAEPPGGGPPDQTGSADGEDDAASLRDLRIRPRNADLSRGVDAYNQEQLETGGSVITRLVVNATTLNSGGRFLFSSVEVGDWYLGHFRRDELEALMERRWLVREATDEELRALVAGGESDRITTTDDPRAVAGLARWWRRGPNGDGAPPEGWTDLYARLARGRFPGELPTASLGALRQAKVPAWYLRRGWELEPRIEGGRSREGHWRRLCAVLGDIDPGLARNVRTSLARDDDGRARFLEYLIELYLLRTAERVSPRFDRDWEDLTVGDAVGASACFPPVFPPFVLLGLYDDAHVTRLSLTDGGVYDNAGIVALLDEGCTSIIASDTGATFRDLPAAPRGHAGLTLRVPTILMRVVGSFQRLTIRERRRVSRDVEDVVESLPEGDGSDAARDALRQLQADRELRDLAYFHMSTPPPEPEHGPPPLRLDLDGRRLAGMRTDLDAFGEVEIAGLVNHGYDTADRFVRRYIAGYARPEWAEAEPRPPKPAVGGPRVERVIDAGASRFFRAVRLRAPATMAALLALLMGLVAAAASLNAGVVDLWGYAVAGIGSVPAGLGAAVDLLPGPLAALLRWIPRVIPDVVAPWLAGLLTAPLVLAAVAGAAAALLAVLWVRGAPAPRPVPGRMKSPARGRVRTARKWTASYAWNVLWLAWALPLLIAVGATVIAGVEWVVFFLPWRRRARIRPGDVREAREPAAPEEASAGALQPR